MAHMAGGGGAASHVGIGPARQGDAMAGARQPVQLFEDTILLAAPIGAELGVQQVEPLTARRGAGSVVTSAHPEK
jgi:hypothetical protein